MGNTMDPNELIFQREKAAFEQNSEQVRGLNQIMWQVPTIALTLTGGLWYAVATIKGADAEIRFGLLIFGALGNFSLALMVVRVRDVLQAYLEKIGEFHPPSYPNVPSGWSLLPPRLGKRGVQTVFTAMMYIAALASFVGAWCIWTGRWGVSVCP